MSQAEEVLLNILERHYRQNPSVAAKGEGPIRRAVIEKARAGDWEGCLRYLPRAWRLLAFTLVIAWQESHAG